MLEISPVIKAYGRLVFTGIATWEAYALHWDLIDCM